MVSKLFQMAAGAGRALAGKGVPRRSLGSVVAQSLRSQQTQQQAKRLADGPQSGSLDAFLQSMGPMGDVVSAALGLKRGWPRQQSDVEAAIALIRALGGEVLTKDRQSPHFQRGLKAAKQLLEEVEILPEFPQGQPGKPPPKSPAGKPPAAPDEEEWPEEHDIQLLGRGSTYHEPDWEELQTKEILTPGSSNVYSFIYEAETPSKGILYVTFKRWTPGQKGRPNSPGPTYAYYNVPRRTYNTFTQQATSSAGGAVWDYLRVRGTQWDHQFPYRLVSGSLVPGGGTYVPRKATKRGFAKRNLPAMGIGRRGFQRSTLPEMKGLPNRGLPARGRPNRGKL